MLLHYLIANCNVSPWKKYRSRSSVMFSLCPRSVRNAPWTMPYQRHKILKVYLSSSTWHLGSEIHGCFRCLSHFQKNKKFMNIHMDWDSKKAERYISPHLWPMQPCCSLERQLSTLFSHLESNNTSFSHYLPVLATSISTPLHSSSLVIH